MSVRGILAGTTLATTLVGATLAITTGNAATGGGSWARAALATGGAQLAATNLQAGTPLATAPAKVGVDSTATTLDAPDKTTKSLVSASAAEASATNAADAYSSASKLTGVRIVLGGASLVTASELTATTDCTATTTPTATVGVGVDDLTVDGTPVPTAAIQGFSRTIDLPTGDTVTVGLASTRSAGNDGATAQALHVHLDLKHNGTLVTASDVALATASCQVPVATAPSVTGIAPTHGPTAGGTTVTVQGTGLGSATGVKICGQTVTPGGTDNTGTSLTFTTPPCDTAGGQDVTVTFGGAGGEQQSPTPFTYDANRTAAATGTSANAAQTATVDKLSPDHGTTEGGTLVTIEGSGLQTAASVSLCHTVVTGLEVAPDGSHVRFASPPCDAGATPTTLSFDDGSAAAPLTYTYVAPTGPETFAELARFSALSPTTGPTAGGTPLTVTGSRLDEATDVTVCGTVVKDPTVSADGTQLTVKAPSCPTAGAHLVSVGFADGSRRAAARVFDYVAPATASGGTTGGGTIAGAAGAGGTAAGSASSGGQLPHTGLSGLLAMTAMLPVAAGLGLVRWRRRQSETA